MPRRSYPSPTLAAAVRGHFALTQAELARFVGVSRSLLADVEAGRRTLADAPGRRLWVLARHLPPPDGQGPPAPALAPAPDPALPLAPAPDLPGPLDPAPLRARLRRCRFLALKARFLLGQRQRPAQAHARRRWALGVLHAALAPPAATPPPATPPARLAYPLATPDPAADARWLARLAADTAAAPVPLSATQRALALLRLHLLETEISALEALLEG